MNSEAQMYLADLVASARAEYARNGAEETQIRAFSAFSSALSALQAVHAVTDAERHDWTNRMLVALGQEALEPQSPGSSAVRFISFRDHADAPADSPPPDIRFLGLIPAQDPDRPIAFGGRAQILGVERYDLKVAVAWRIAPLQNVEEKFAAELDALERDIEGLSDPEKEISRYQALRHLNRPGSVEMTLTDDVGTEYHPSGGGSSGGGNESVGRSEFYPGIPPEATVISIAWKGHIFNVPSGSDPEVA